MKMLTETKLRDLLARAFVAGIAAERHSAVPPDGNAQAYQAELTAHTNRVVDQLMQEADKP